MLQVLKNEISLHKCSGGTAHLHTLEATLDVRFPSFTPFINNAPHKQLLYHKCSWNVLKDHSWQFEKYILWHREQNNYAAIKPVQKLFHCHSHSWQWQYEKYRVWYTEQNNYAGIKHI